MSEPVSQSKTSYASIINPKWGSLFFLGGAAILIVLGVTARMLFNLSAESDRVFAVEALISGLVVIWFIKWKFNSKLIIAPPIKIPFLYIWILLCAYVFIFTPFN